MKVEGHTPKFYYDAGGLTIDIHSLQFMKLTDFVVDNETFYEKLLQSTDITNYLGKKVVSDDNYLQAVRNGIRDEAQFNSEISQNEHKFFVTPTSIGVIVWVSHAAGDYVLIEIPTVT
jgi:hypothetical protein